MISFRPCALLPWLLGGAVGLGGMLQGLQWRAASAGASSPDLDEKLRAASEEISLLKRENDSLRSLAQGGGEFSVPRELLERVEKEFGLKFLSSPVVHRIAPEELRDRVAAAIESGFGPSGVDDRQEAWRLMGLIGGQFTKQGELLAQLAAARAVGARGWFDDASGEGWVTDKFDAKNIPDQAALVRLLARILLNQNFPPPPAYPGDEPARAREALFQGAALGAETRFFAANVRALGFLPMKSNTEAEQLFASLSPFVRGLATFPATEGKGFSDTLFVQGNEKLQTALRNSPQTTRAILQPGEPSAAPPPLHLPEPPEEPYLSESAGQLGLRLWLAAQIGEEKAREISSHWKNDRYLLLPDGESFTAVIWEIEVDSKETADQLETAAKARVEGFSAEQKQQNFSVSRPAPNRIRFLNTATADLLEKLKSR